MVPIDLRAARALRASGNSARIKVRMVLAAVAIMLCSAGAARSATPAAAEPVVREYRVEVALDIGTDGRVVAVELPADVPSMLAGPAKESIAHWHFKTPVREGHAVKARTYARVTLQLVRQPEGNFGLRAVYRANGPRLTFARLPAYPRNELRQRGQGTIVMEAVVQPDGTLTSIEMASHRINHPNPGAFRKSAEDVMRHCHAEPERVDGKPVATRIQVPFVYALQEISRSQALSRQAGQTAPGADGGPIGEAVALDSPVQWIAGPSG